MTAKITGLSPSFTGGPIEISSTVKKADPDTNTQTEYTVLEIADFVLSGKDAITAVTFSNTKDITVGACAFYNDQGIVTVTFNNSGTVTLNGGYEFQSNTNLKNVFVTGSGNVVFNGKNWGESYAFYQCSSLESFKATGTGTVIFNGGYYFYGVGFIKFDITLRNYKYKNVSTVFNGISSFDSIKTYPNIVTAHLICHKTAIFHCHNAPESYDRMY